MDIHEAVLGLKKLNKDFAARKAYITTHLQHFVSELEAQKAGKSNFAKSPSIVTYFRKAHKLDLDRTEAQLIAESYRGKPGRNPYAGKQGHHKDMEVTTSTGIFKQPHVVGGSIKHG